MHTVCLPETAKAIEVTRQTMSEWAPYPLAYRPCTTDGVISPHGSYNRQENIGRYEGEQYTKSLITRWFSEP